MSSLAVTVVGHDRPGIIAAAADALAGCGMNLEDSSMTLLRGHFAMTLVCAGDATVDEVRAALAPLASSGLDVAVRAVAPDPDVPSTTANHLVTVYGADRLGIVARLVGVVAEAGANVTDLTTRLSGDLYVLLAEVALPDETDADALRDRLAAVGNDLGVEVTLRPLENDEL
ncbi:glycine cleavage system protein R [Microlunatus flavus]|uniref:Glycine cleavage system transcriptional repressor n=1 Tax=Microlunatus flavus TaxID=1036181 RepID=A0A1H9K5X1_9ACTN|nr:ACT domain-containing protein [Microlunatus flavus]SEQ94462.1 glycine cleavage system transcriptional repressor [Microlunatus flavus]